MNATVGNLDWSECRDCKHYRSDIGGCAPLDGGKESILFIDLEFNTVECERYEAKDS